MAAAHGAQLTRSLQLALRLAARLRPARSKMVQFGVLAVGDREMLCRPCVDCGLRTGCFCDWCLAADRLPDEKWAAGQLTPLCTHCDREYGACHFCREEPHWVTPPPHDLPQEASACGFQPAGGGRGDHPQPGDALFSVPSRESGGKPRCGGCVLS